MEFLKQAASFVLVVSIVFSIMMIIEDAASGCQRKRISEYRFPKSPPFWIIVASIALGFMLTDLVRSLVR